MDGYSSKSSSPSKSTKGPEDDTSRFAMMQRMHRMKTQYQLLQKLQDDFTLSSDEDEKSSESKDEQVPMASPSTAKKASGKRGRKQSLWTNVKSVVAPKAAGSASLMLAVQAAKAAEIRNKSKGNSEDGQASADEPNGSKHSPRRKVHHLEGPAMLGEHRGGRHLTHRNIDVSGGDDDDEAGTEGGGDGDGSMLGHSKDANDATPPVLPPEEEDIQLHEYFKEYEVRCPDDDPLPAFHMPPPPHLMDELHVEAEHEGIVIGKVPKAAIEEQKQTLKARLWEERDRSVRAMKRKEEDLLWREVLAKKRVEEVEKESAERLAREKAKVEESKLQRERQLAREFRRARESLEVSIRNQHAQMGEVFGQLDSHAHETLSRKMYIKSTALPQPVEFRIRFLKAVKTKLPKGAYLLMVTQYESLGGKPLAWTEIGTYGIGEEFPGTTKAVKHAGRYFDRTMKFEDSCYALCPSTSNLKPGFCFVIELFQLQSRTNKEDKPVAWAALPMCNEEMSIVEGKFRLPLLRGQHTPLVQSYKQIERAIASDLDNWLCNIYFDVRKFSLSEMNTVVANSDYYHKSIKGNIVAQQEIAKQRTQIKDIVKLNRYINLDFLNKRLSLQNGRGKYSRTFGQKEKENEQLLKLDSDTLFHRPRYEDSDETKKHQSHLASAADSLVDRTLEDEELRRRVLRTGGLTSPFRSYEDGFTLSSKVDKWSHDSRQASIFGPIRRFLGQTKAYLTGNVYIPSEGDEWRETRRYKNPHTSSSPTVLSRGQWEPATSIPHFARQDSILDKKSAGGGDAGVDDSNGEDIEEGSSSKKLGSSSSGRSAEKNSSEETQIEKEKRLQRKNERRARRRELKEAAVKSLSGNEKATKNGLAIRNGDGDSVYTSDKPDGKVVQHSVKIVHANSGEIMRVIDGNDAHLDSDGFSDESDSSVDSDLEELHALQKAQENGEDYFNTPEGTDSRADMTVLERGLETETSGVTSALHEEQSGKLVGVESVESSHGRYYASSGLGKRVLRRNQSDGLRLDSEMHDNNDKSNTADSSKNSAELPSPSKNVQISDDIAISSSLKKLWHPLDSRRDQELYDMALAGDISKRAHLLPGALAASKWRFIMLEAFGDLMGHKLFSFDFYATCVTLVFSFWLRIYVHYLAQYLYLGFIEVPTYGFEMQPLQIRYKYMSSSMMQAYEIALICIGPAANIVVFLCLMYAGQGMSSLAGNLPDGISTFLSAYGLMVILDPLMVLIVDLIQMNYNCPTSSAACIEDYTQTSCTCFTGDWVKLWDRMEVEGGGSGGITGVLITLIVYFSFAILAGFVYYAYLINIHRNGRILDLWRRIHSLAQEFFVPDDFEISREEMIHICTKAGLWRGGGGDIRRVSVTKLIEKDAEDLEFISVTKLYAIHEMEMDGSNKKLYRQFLLSPDGSIIEVFSDFKINDKFVPTTEKENQLLLMENWNQDKKAKSNEAPKLTATQRTSKGMFRGLEKA